MREAVGRLQRVLDGLLRRRRLALAQTFSLLATSRGLGPFTTAAIQDTFLEKLIGLDGVKEFPVYLCGAGVPAKKLTSP